jgi:transcriptional regulator with XRE-family HTH domain
MSIEKLNFFEKKFKKEIGRRLADIRKSLDESQKTFSERFSTNQSTIANIERGVIYPNMVFIYYLIIELKVNPFWFFVGDGNMFFEAKSRNKFTIDEVYKIINVENDDLLDLLRDIQVPAVQYFLLSQYLFIRNTPDCKKAIDEYFNSEVKSHGNEGNPR